ncbi:MAG: hypothetical protein NC388_03175 [Clostridium sp.]|nr:hypothetical protein [Clostridium sp.]
MADNYLEKQREIYDTRKRAWEAGKNDARKTIARIKAQLNRQKPAAETQGKEK